MKKLVSLNATWLKLIAVVAMTVDHAAWLFVPLWTPLGMILHAIGRLAFPIMAFFIVEGFHHTRDVKKYWLRLAGLAIVAHVAYAFCFNHPLIFDFSQGMVDLTSVLWGFSFGLLALMIYRNEKLSNWAKADLIALCIIASIPADWSWVCVVMPLVMEMNYGHWQKQMVRSMVVALVYALGSCLLDTWLYSYQFATVAAIPILCLYNGKKGQWQWMKWFFYIYYPLHLVILGGLRVGLGIEYYP